MEHPKSESTLKRHKYIYKGLKYINDLGFPCDYRIEKDGKDTKTIAKYYKGRFLMEYGIQ